jgi:hypothetical protein
MYENFCSYYYYMKKFHALVPALLIIEVFCANNVPVVSVAVETGGAVRDVDRLEVDSEGIIVVFKLFRDEASG